MGSVKWGAIDRTIDAAIDVAIDVGAGFSLRRVGRAQAEACAYYSRRPDGRAQAEACAYSSRPAGLARAS